MTGDLFISPLLSSVKQHNFETNTFALTDIQDLQQSGNFSGMQFGRCKATTHFGTEYV